MGLALSDGNKRCGMQQPMERDTVKGIMSALPVAWHQLALSADLEGAAAAAPFGSEAAHYAAVQLLQPDLLP